MVRRLLRTRPMTFPDPDLWLIPSVTRPFDRPRLGLLVSRNYSYCLPGTRRLLVPVKIGLLPATIYRLIACLIFGLCMACPENRPIVPGI
jgi:hypothetical protein